MTSNSVGVYWFISKSTRIILSASGILESVSKDKVYLVLELKCQPALCTSLFISFKVFFASDASRGKYQ